MQEPLLLHGRKFDIRLYVLVASTSPTVLFWREGYIRRALQPYDRTAPFEGNEVRILPFIRTSIFEYLFAI